MLSEDIYRLNKMRYTQHMPHAISAQQPDHTLFEHNGRFDPVFTMHMPCRVDFVARYRYEQRFRTLPIPEDDYRLFYIYEGQARAVCGGSTGEAGAGDMVFLQGGRGDMLTQTGDNPLELLIIHCSGYLAESYYALLTGENRPVLQLRNDRGEALLHKIVFYMKYPSNSSSALLALAMTQLFSALLLDTMDPAAMNHPEWFLTAVDMINQHYASDITIGQIAERLQVSPSYFQRLFYSYTSMTPYQYILQFRINRAKELLTDPQLQIKYISQAVGFKSVNHFIAHFRKITTMTPGEYRKSIMSDIRFD